MSEFTPHFAPIAALLFLGAIFVIGVSVLVLLYAAVRRSALAAKLGAGLAFAMAIGYFILLCGVSVASSEKVLAPGGWKVFCEIDCHTWYSVTDSFAAGFLGPEMHGASATGQFVIVRLKTWFNENTISARRGNSPLIPNPRRSVLVDESGRLFGVSNEGKATLARLGVASTPLDEALRPGESYTTDLVFDVPSDARELRLLLTEDDPATRFVIGHENSLLHKKIYLALPPISDFVTEGAK